MEELKHLLGTAPYFLTGSRVIVNPPITDTDIDVVIWYEPSMSEVLQANGFEITPHEEYPNETIKAVYRKGEINVIAVDTMEDYNRWLSATRLGTLMNLTEKRQRVLLFQFLTEGTVRSEPDLKLLPAPEIDNDTTPYSILRLGDCGPGAGPFGDL